MGKTGAVSDHSKREEIDGSREAGMGNHVRIGVLSKTGDSVFSREQCKLAASDKTSYFVFHAEQQTKQAPPRRARIYQPRDVSFITS